jgi:hypothetical protein
MNDTISRSALITELENRMVTAGDPVIKYLFARLIDIVKEQPAVQAPVPTSFELCPTGIKFYYEDGRVTEVKL